MMKGGKRQRFERINRWQRQSIKLSVGPALGALHVHVRVDRDLPNRVARRDHHVY